MMLRRTYQRDPGLPVAVGDHALQVPGSDEIRALLVEHMLGPEDEVPEQIQWDYARWKPDVSVTAGYRLVFQDGLVECLTYKRYLDSKPKAIASSSWRNKPRKEVLGPLAPYAVLPQRNAILWISAADRKLPGMPRLLDLKRWARLLERESLTPDGRMCAKKSRVSILRYKPERRAVAVLDYQIHQGSGERKFGNQRLLVRILPPKKAEVVAANRKRMESQVEQVFFPRLLSVESRTGILLEEWLEVEVPEPGQFRHAPAAGRLLARLHTLPLANTLRSVEAPTLRNFHDLFAIDQDLVDLAQGIPPLQGAVTCWIHGDFHAEQVAFERKENRHVLLDLDELEPGNPYHDLASWISGHMAHDPEVSWEAAAEPLLASYLEYASSCSIQEDSLRRCVAFHLMAQGAAAIRRLEHQARDKARRCLEQAHEILACAGEAR